MITLLETFCKSFKVEPDFEAQADLPSKVTFDNLPGMMNKNHHTNRKSMRR